MPEIERDIARRERQRLADLYRTLAMIGVDTDTVRELEQSSCSDSAYDEAAVLRHSARETIIDAGLDPDRYVSDEPIDIEVRLSPLPERTLGSLALLGTTERRLEELDFDAPISLRMKTRLQDFA